MDIISIDNCYEDDGLQLVLAELVRCNSEAQADLNCPTRTVLVAILPEFRDDGCFDRLNVLTVPVEDPGALTPAELALMEAAAAIIAERKRRHDVALAELDAHPITVGEAVTEDKQPTPPVSPLTRSSRQRLIEAFDALGRIENGQPPKPRRTAPHSRSNSCRCDFCGAALSSGPVHDPTCPIGAALETIVHYLPAFPKREAWIAEGACGALAGFGSGGSR